MLFQEVQRGKDAMRNKLFSREIGTNGACAIRLIIGSVYSGEAHAERHAASEQERRYLITADSWFGSVKLAENLKLLWRDQGEYKLDKNRGENPNAHEFIGSVKTNSGWFPKKELKKRMKHFPSGAHLVMQCCTPETNIQLVAIGYKFSARKTIFFVMTKNAGQTAPGPKPYVAKFPDRYGNVQERRVKRPEVLSDYFADSDAVDAHNHCRQFRLGLEKYWLTQNPWVRNNCTLIGMTVIDAFRAVKHQLAELAHDKEFTVAAFAKGVAYDCLYNNIFDAVALQSPSLYLEASNITPLERQYLYMAQVHAEAMKKTNASMMENFAKNLAAIQIPNMVGATQSIVASPLSMSAGGSGTGNYVPDFFDEMHDAVASEKSQHTHRSIKRSCRVCKTGTRFQCSHPTCQAARPLKCDAKYTGTPICNPTVGPRKLKDNPNNRLTCLQIHRAEVKAKTMEDMKLIAKY